MVGVLRIPTAVYTLRQPASQHYQACIHMKCTVQAQSSGARHSTGNFSFNLATRFLRSSSSSSSSNNTILLRCTVGRLQNNIIVMSIKLQQQCKSIFPSTADYKRLAIAAAAAIIIIKSGCWKTAIFVVVAAAAVLLMMMLVGWIQMHKHRRPTCISVLPFHSI